MSARIHRPRRPLWLVILANWVAFLPLAPAVFRDSPVLFIHLDRYLDPEGAGDQGVEPRRGGRDPVAPLDDATARGRRRPDRPTDRRAT